MNQVVYWTRKFWTGNAKALFRGSHRQLTMDAGWSSQTVPSFWPNWLRPTNNICVRMISPDILARGNPAPFGTTKRGPLTQARRLLFNLLPVAAPSVWVWVCVCVSVSADGRRSESLMRWQRVERRDATSVSACFHPLLSHSPSLSLSLFLSLSRSSFCRRRDAIIWVGDAALHLPGGWCRRRWFAA